MIGQIVASIRQTNGTQICISNYDVLCCFLLLAILSKFYIKCDFSEYKRSLIYQYITKLTSKKYGLYDRYINLKKFSIFNLIILFITIAIYPIVLDRFLIPLLILVLFDYIFLVSIVPCIKKLIFNIQIIEKAIDKNFLFSHTSRIPSKLGKYKEVLMLSIPDNDLREDKKDTLDIKNFIWIIRLFSQKNEIRYFIYTLIMIIVIFSFLILFHRIYFIGLFDQKGGYFVFIYLSLWLIYVVVRLRSLIGFDYFLHIFKDYETKTKYYSYLRYLTIYKVDRTIDKHNIYTIQEILNDLNYIKQTVGKNLDYFISLVSTVLFMAILTFVLS
jgi:hypothetical protein